MANTVAPERRRFRAFFIIVLPVLFLACIGGAVQVVVATQSILIPTPFVIAALGVTRLSHVSMFWVSTPEERRLLVPGMNRELFAGLLRAWLNRKHDRDRPRLPPAP